MKKWLMPLCLAATAAFVTGCPHNEYVVDLTPHEKVIERKLTFYREDGTDTNGVINYQTFPADELKAINALYPARGISSNGDRHVVVGEFTGALPHDIGGAGTYSNFTTSLGSAALYSERFRGNDDLATPIEEWLHTSDKIVDYVLGWSKLELGDEPNYQDLRRFLDTDFRRDVKNLGFYWWLGDIAANEKPQGREEHLVRMGQYLVEHGYLTAADLSALFRSFVVHDKDEFSPLIRHLVARKLGISESQPRPKSFAFLRDTDAMEASWEKFLATTPEYRHLLGHWQRQQLLATWLNPAYLIRKTGAFGGPRTNAVPPKPQPTEVLPNPSSGLVQIHLLETTDVVTVNLSLPTPPLHSNGQWDSVGKKVTWQRNIENGTNRAPLPAFFFATWAQTDEAFQMAHFGKVLISGDDLVNYSLWNAALTPREAKEWEALLAGLRPENAPLEKITVFHFSDEITPTGTNTQAAMPSAYLRELFKATKQ